MNSMTKAEMQAEIDRLNKKVAELEGEVKGLHFALSKLEKTEPVNPWYQYYGDARWTWPNIMSATTEPQTYKTTC